MSLYCVVIAGRLPGDKEDAAVWGPIAKGFRLDWPAFAEQRLPRLPLVVKAGLEVAAATDLASQLTTMGIEARAHPVDSGMAVFSRDDVVRGPVPFAALGDYVRPGELYRRQEASEWSVWQPADDDLDLAAFAAPVTADVPPPLPDAEPEPVPSHVPVVAMPPPPFARSDLTSGPWDKPALPSVGTDVPPPWQSDRRAPASDGLSPASFQRRAPRRSSTGGSGAFVVLVVIGVLLLIAGGTYYVMHSRASIADVATVRPAMAPPQPPAPLPAPAPSPRAPAGRPTEEATAAAVTAAPPAPPRASIPPSFDCQKASSPGELAICGSDELSRLDAEMGRAFRAASSASSQERASALKSDQRAWLRDREQRCAADVSCLSVQLTNRISALHEAEAQGVADSRRAQQWQGKLDAGEQCFRAANYDCSIQMAQTVLNSDPDNERAADLLQRAKSSQKKALEGNWKIQ